MVVETLQQRAEVGVEFDWCFIPAAGEQITEGVSWALGMGNRARKGGTNRVLERPRASSAYITIVSQDAQREGWR